jgi:uncharacterized protein YhfF
MDEEPLPVTALGLPGQERQELNRLTLRGVKTATTSLFADYEREGETLHATGSRYRLVDSVGEPVAVIEVTPVRTCRFDEVDLRHAQAEGEGFVTVDEWRTAHEKVWPEVVGSSVVVLEEFRLVRPVPSRH